MVVRRRNLGIQMKQKELTEKFLIIWKWKTHFGLHGLYKILLRCKGQNYRRIFICILE